MAYTSLQLPHTLSPGFTYIVRNQLEPLLSDVHAMLRLPIDTEDGLQAGCNLSAASTLLSVVSGASVTIYNSGGLTQRGNRGELFRQLLINHYPWNQERHYTNGRFDADAASDLYDLFRNPLSHALGIFGPNEIPPGHRVVIEKGSISESEILILETTTVRPSSWPWPTLRRDGNDYVLWVRAFYWGVRKMIEDLAAQHGTFSPPTTGGATITRST